MTTATPTPAILPLGRMARRLGVTQSWLKAEAGRVPCVRADRRFLFAPDAVERAIAERATGEGRSDG